MVNVQNETKLLIIISLLATALVIMSYVMIGNAFNNKCEKGLQEPITDAPIKVIQTCSPHIFETPQYPQFTCKDSICSNGLRSCYI